MILIDGNYFARKFFHMAKIELKNKHMSAIDFFRHQFLINIINIKNKFSQTYGDVVIGKDYKSWRSEFYKEYKESRKEKNAEPEALEFYNIFEELCNLLIEATNTKVIKVLNAEADDILYTLSRLPGKHLAYSGDKDIGQCANENVDFYNFNDKRIVEATSERIKLNLIEHILMGDNSDDIKNVGWNAGSTKEFDKWIKNKYNITMSINVLYKLISEESTILEEYKEETNLSPFKKIRMGKETVPKYSNDENLKFLLNSNPIIKRNYLLNSFLIDMSKIPDCIKEDIINSYNNYPKKIPNYSLLYQYCDAYKLNQVKEKIRYLA